MADLLGVRRSQPLLWRTGAEALAAADARAVLDLDYVILRLQQVWTVEVAETWLRSANAHLGGATPQATILQRGALEVIVAMDAEAEGAYA